MHWCSLQPCMPLHANIGCTHPCARGRYAAKKHVDGELCLILLSGRGLPLAQFCDRRSPGHVSILSSECNGMSEAHQPPPRAFSRTPGGPSHWPDRHSHTKTTILRQGFVSSEAEEEAEKEISSFQSMWRGLSPGMWRCDMRHTFVACFPNPLPSDTPGGRVGLCRGQRPSFRGRCAGGWGDVTHYLAG